ncbi:PREDICTED: protein CHROMATIN REMODELING 35-like [Nicotiana attenuata]|uniref:Protein chromatin remodeling 35 n=1 Tax=Nicotiana attenuata TaxID=49451 RepID=A0A1J6JBM9_NICAT|nr:PREDICTED: protein CHROMATIN REMODELING 35-like [Nicotiana attenuata]OIT07111.1 protein chromatin remodeling 35 [Nicotiana attenuata]
MAMDLGSRFINPTAKRLQPCSPRDLFSKGTKKIKFDESGSQSSPTVAYSWREECEHEKGKVSSGVFGRSDPFAIPDLLEALDSGKFGSVTREIEDLIKRRMKLVNSCFASDHSLPNKVLELERNFEKGEFKGNQPAPDVIDLEDEQEAKGVASAAMVPSTCFGPSAGPVVIIDSDDEDTQKDFISPSQGMIHTQKSSISPFQGIPLQNAFIDFQVKDFVGQGRDSAEKQTLIEAVSLGGEAEIKKDKGVYVGVQDDDEIDDGAEQPDEGLNDIWNEMSFALECSKDVAAEPSPNEHTVEEEDECDHSFILKDDIGYVCRICGVIQRSIDTIIEFQYSKASKSIRTYHYEGRSAKDTGHAELLPEGIISSDDIDTTEICVHPRHKKLMKAHQVEGFNFLVSNLLKDKGGCIMAHAPGSGKTFMIISFLQSFMANNDRARPLVVLPRGILATWKKEFLRWQVDEIPLYDFYSVKADNRSQQLEVLKQWSQERSILFLGYKQFSTIVCDNVGSTTAAACQEILLKCPSILILDEGHTPRNQDTDVLTSLEKVQTRLKVVLSGTLYQNHVKEVFNILNLVRPKFLKLEDSRNIKRTILSKVASSGRKNLLKKSNDNDFYELVEHTLLKDDNFSRKSSVILGLRDMTKKVLHYYKGDFLEELPGLVDYTVLLNLHPKQKSEVAELKKLGRKFKISSEGSAMYVHPQLKSLSRNFSVKERVDEEKIDMLLENLEVREGVKAKFYLNLLQLCESKGEKLLVFSQYLLPLKFLERLTVRTKGYSLGKEIFLITGDSDSETRESSMERFNTSADARVFFGSIKACGEGISLVGASRIIILDVHLNPSVTRQAIGRAFRPGQVRKVYTYRLIASGSPEEEDHQTCFKKESIAKLWFEWSEYYAQPDFEMETVNIENCDDMFLESPRLNEDVVALYKR